jgi:hypothetical protein
MPKPAARPISEASTPIVSASTSTEPSTWRRAAPTIRSSPNSRERWATVIESVLKIVNAPTRIATKPNTIRTIVMIEMNIFRPSSVKRSCSFAVMTVASEPTLAATALRTSAPDVPSLPTARIES